MAPCAAAFVSLSPFQAGAIVALTLAAIALTWFLAIDEGKDRGRRQQREQARQYGSEGLRLIRGEDDGE